MVDLPVIASINRRQWDETEDFTIAGQTSLAVGQRAQEIYQIYERRKADNWKHPVIGYSLSYSRLIELEVRLLEKEWTDKLRRPKQPMSRADFSRECGCDKRSIYKFMAAKTMVCNLLRHNRTETLAKGL